MTAGNGDARVAHRRQGTVALIAVIADERFARTCYSQFVAQPAATIATAGQAVQTRLLSRKRRISGRSNNAHGLAMRCHQNGAIKIDVESVSSSVRVGVIRRTTVMSILSRIALTHICGTETT